MKQVLLLAFLATSICVRPAAGQVAFTNLDFESASFSVPPAPHDLVPVSDALPGWTLSVGGIQSLVYYDSISLGGSLASLSDSQNVPPSVGVIDGAYSLALFTGPGAPSPTWICQSGAVPADSMSLQFVARPGETPSKLSVAFAGTVLAFQPLKNLSSGYTLYGADISTFASTSGQLSFTVPAINPPFLNYAVFDDIQFSPNPIPEPGVWGLALCGGLGLWWIPRHRRARP
jgi:hypothetical protein